MNLYHINADIIRFNIFNLNADKVGLTGQYQFYYDLKSDKYLLGKMGGFGSLTWYPKKQNIELFSPTTEQAQFLKPYIQKRLQTACYYDRDKTCSQGKFLLKSMREKEAKGEYLSSYKQYFVWEKEDVEPDKRQKELNLQAIRKLNAMVRTTY